MTSPRLLELAVSTAPCGIAVIDETGGILVANPALHRMFGYEPNRLIGRSIGELVPAALRGVSGEVRATEPELLAKRAPTCRRAEARRQDGTLFHIEVDLSPTTHDGQPVVLAAIVDCTWRHDIETELFGRQEFERVLAETAAGFLTRSDAELDEHITASQRQLAVVLDVQRSSLWQSTDSGDLRYTHLWSSDPSIVLPPPDHVSAETHFPWVTARIRAGHLVQFQALDDIPDEMDRRTFRRIGARAGVVLPLRTDGRLIGALTFATVTRERTWDAYAVDRLQLIASVFSSALARRESRRAIDAANEEVRRLRDQLAAENAELRREVHTLKGPRVLATQSRVAQVVLSQIEQVAPTTATVLLLGETGVGKEVFAGALHELSPRRHKRMVRVNCAAIPSALIESELFGRERGAYTGAMSRQTGRFELADHSTIFLDEVGELSLEAQAKLLHVLQDRVVERLGGSHPIKVDVRVIAATNRDLEQAVLDRTFREDLFYRLNVFPIRVPPLRERVEDIPTLVWSFVNEFSSAFGKNIVSLSKGSLHALQAYAWPGNIRELRNVVERAVIVASGPHLVIDPPRPILAPARRTSLKFIDVEIEHIRTVLDSAGWRIRGAGGAADLLGIKPTTLESRMAKLGIVRSDKPAGTPPRRPTSPGAQRYED